MADFKLIIRTRKQEAELYRGNELIKTYRVSSALNGLGCEFGSCKTPVGLLRVAKKIGEGCRAGTVFRCREVTGEVWSPEVANPLFRSDEDLVLTRILWLEGCEPMNSNTLDRHIYLHGTNQEHLLGQAVSHGCIRFSNDDILELFSWVPEGISVEVVP